MRILKGFEALEYVLNNKDAILYSRKGLTLQYNKGYKRIAVYPNKYYHDSIVINDQTMEIEWYTENKKKVLVKVYVDGKLQEVQDHYFFDLENNLKKLLEGVRVSYEKRVKDDGDVTVKYEIYE